MELVAPAGVKKVRTLVITSRPETSFVGRLQRRNGTLDAQDQRYRVFAEANVRIWKSRAQRPSARRAPHVPKTRFCAINFPLADVKRFRVHAFRRLSMNAFGDLPMVRPLLVK